MPWKLTGCPWSNHTLLAQATSQSGCWEEREQCNLLFSHWGEKWDTGKLTTACVTWSSVILRQYFSLEHKYCKLRLGLSGCFWAVSQEKTPSLSSGLSLNPTSAKRKDILLQGSSISSLNKGGSDFCFTTLPGQTSWGTVPKAVILHNWCWLPHWSVFYNCCKSTVIFSESGPFLVPLSLESLGASLEPVLHPTSFNLI